MLKSTFVVENYMSWYHVNVQMCICYPGGRWVLISEENHKILTYRKKHKQPPRARNRIRQYYPAKFRYINFRRTKTHFHTARCYKHYTLNNFYLIHKAITSNLNATEQSITYSHAYAWLTNAYFTYTFS